VRPVDLARLLRVGSDRVVQLEAQGLLPRATMTPGGRRWRWGDVRVAVEQLMEERRRPRPDRRTRRDTRLASRVRQDRSLLARAFFRCWSVRGLDEAVDICRQHGVQKLQGQSIEGIARATAALDAAATIWRALR
jgi:hypothetical protein